MYSEQSGKVCVIKKGYGSNIKYFIVYDNYNKPYLNVECIFDSLEDALVLYPNAINLTRYIRRY